MKFAHLAALSCFLGVAGICPAAGQTAGLCNELKEMPLIKSIRDQKAAVDFDAAALEHSIGSLKSSCAGWMNNSTQVGKEINGLNTGREDVTRKNSAYRTRLRDLLSNMSRAETVLSYLSESSCRYQLVDSERELRNRRDKIQKEAESLCAKQGAIPPPGLLRASAFVPEWSLERLLASRFPLLGLTLSFEAARAEGLRFISGCRAAAAIPKLQELDKQAAGVKESFDELKSHAAECDCVDRSPCWKAQNSASSVASFVRSKNLPFQLEDTAVAVKTLGDTSCEGGLKNAQYKILQIDSEAKGIVAKVKAKLNSPACQDRR